MITAQELAQSIAARGQRRMTAKQTRFLLNLMERDYGPVVTDRAGGTGLYWNDDETFAFEIKAISSRNGVGILEVIEY